MPTPKARASQMLRKINAGSHDIGGIAAGGKILGWVSRFTKVNTAATTTKPILVVLVVTFSPPTHFTLGTCRPCVPLELRLALENTAAASKRGLTMNRSKLGK